MINFSRRQIAKYAVEQMMSGYSIAALAKQLAAALSAVGKQKEVELLLSDINQEIEDRGLLATARLTVTRPLSAALRREVTAIVKKRAGVKEVILAEEIDKDIIAGIKIETANHAWDKTLARILSQIKETV